MQMGELVFSVLNADLRCQIPLDRTTGEGWMDSLFVNEVTVEIEVLDGESNHIDLVSLSMGLDRGELYPPRASIKP